RGDNLARLRLELGTDITTPRTVFEDLALPRPSLNWRHVLPGLIVAWAVSTMHGIEDLKPRLARGVEDLLHVRNAVIRFSDSPNAAPYLPSFGDEIVVRVHNQQCRELPGVDRSRHPMSSANYGSALSFASAYRQS